MIRRAKVRSFRYFSRMDPPGEKRTKPAENGARRDARGRFVPGTAPGPGRPRRAAASRLALLHELARPVSANEFFCQLEDLRRADELVALTVRNSSIDFSTRLLFQLRWKIHALATACLAQELQDLSESYGGGDAGGRGRGGCPS